MQKNQKCSNLKLKVLSFSDKKPTFIIKKRKSTFIKVNQSIKQKNDIENTQNVLLRHLIRSKEDLEQREYSYLKDMEAELKKVMKYLKEPSDTFLQNQKLKINKIINSTHKFLFIQHTGTIINSNYVYDKKRRKFFNLFFRKNAIKTLKILSCFFDIYLFTSKLRNEAEDIMGLINSEGPIIVDVLCWENCFLTQKNKMIKDLRIIKNIKLKNSIMIDTNIYSFGFNLQNGIPLLPFDSPENNDFQFQQLLPLLKNIAVSEDVSSVLRVELKLKKVGKFFFLKTRRGF